MKRKTTIIFSSLALLMVLGFYLPGLAGAQSFGSVISNQVIKMDNGDTICLQTPLPTEGNPYPCPIAVDCGTGATLNSADISNVLYATPLSPPSGDSYRVKSLSEDGGGGLLVSIPITYAGVPEQACPKIILRAADTSLGASWVCVGGRCFYR